MKATFKVAGGSSAKQHMAKKFAVGSLAGMFLFSSTAWGQDKSAEPLVCKKFEADVRQYASQMKQTSNTRERYIKSWQDLRSPAQKLAYTLLTGFNMTPHNSAYVAAGLCSMQSNSLN